MDRLAIGRGAAVALIALTLGCASAADIAAPGEASQVPSGAAPITFLPFPDTTLQLVRTSTGAATRARYVVHDQGTWTNLWARVVSNLDPRPAPPAIDFGSRMLVAAAMGTKGTGGFSIAIDSAFTAGDSIYVVVREVSPGRGCNVTFSLTAPFAARLLPRSADPVLFVEESEVQNCP